MGLYPIPQAEEWTPSSISAFYQFKITPFSSSIVFILLIAVPLAIILPFALSCNFHWCTRARRPQEVYLALKFVSNNVDHQVIERVLQLPAVNEKLRSQCWIFGIVGQSVVFICSIVVIVIGCLVLRRTPIGKEAVPDNMLQDIRALMDITGDGDKHSALQQANTHFKGLFQDYAYMVQSAFDVHPDQSEVSKIEPIIAEFKKMKQLIQMLDDSIDVPEGFQHVKYNDSAKFMLMRNIADAFTSSSIFDFYEALQRGGYTPVPFGARLSIFNKYGDKQLVLQKLGMATDDQLFEKSQFYAEAMQVFKTKSEQLQKLMDISGKRLGQVYADQRNLPAFKHFQASTDTVPLLRRLTVLQGEFIKPILIAAGCCGMCASIAVIVTQITCQIQQNPKSASVFMASGPISLVFALFGAVLCACGYYLHFQGFGLRSFYETDYWRDSEGFGRLQRHLQKTGLELDLSTLNSPFIQFSPPRVPLNFSSADALAKSINATVTGGSRADLGFATLQYGVQAHISLSPRAFKVGSASNTFNAAADGRSCFLDGSASLNTKNSLINCLTLDGGTFAAFAAKVQATAVQEISKIGLFSIGQNFLQLQRDFIAELGVQGQTAPKMHVLAGISTQFIALPVAEDVLISKTGLFDMKIAKRPSLNLHALMGTATPFSQPANSTIADVFVACQGFAAFVACMESADAACATVTSEEDKLAADDVERYLEDIIYSKYNIFGVTKPISSAMQAQISKDVAQWDERLRERFQQRYGRQPVQQDYDDRIRPLLEYDPLGVFGAAEMHDRLLVAAKLMRHAAVLARVDFIADKFGSTASGYSKIDNYIDVVATQALANVERIPDMLRGQNYRYFSGKLREVLSFDLELLDKMDQYYILFEKQLLTEPTITASSTATFGAMLMYALAVVALLTSFTTLFQRDALARHLARFEKLELNQDFKGLTDGIPVTRVRDEHKVHHQREMMLIAIADKEVSSNFQ